MKINTKFGLLAGCLIFLGTTYAVAQKHTANHTGAVHESDSNTLVQAVRNATRQYLDVNNAVAAGYGPLFGCVSGSDHGAMGIHYVNPSLLNGTINVTTPQALIYEPQPNGQMKLVGVEYIADQATWLQNNSGPPVLDGRVFLLVGYPNRFTINAFFELHVWAWRDNPQGSFVDWNDRVTCESQ
jgi:hypothetical protein